ncbi:MAG: ChbG/HpnK family deacetylase [Anaerolineales bacterium]|nr:ChbG/HpnK family deacetylase [Anaerolineales bacterium]
MIIVNADDWGRTRAETDAALLCYKEGRITSVSTMIFMEDSDRAAGLAKDAGIDVGLHLNFSQRFTGEGGCGLLQEYHTRIVHYLTLNKYSLLLYIPSLRKQFRYIYQAQVKEFIRLYGRPPSHIDGHQHMHLCTNMLLDKVIPKHEKVRRNFSFWPGEKNLLNRTYRRLVDRWLASRYFVTDYFFALSQVLKTEGMSRVVKLSKVATVELMTHPANTKEYAYLMSDEYLDMLCILEKGTYSLI